MTEKLDLDALDRLLASMDARPVTNHTIVSLSRMRPAVIAELRALRRVAAAAKKIDETILSPDGDDIDCPCACGFGDGREGDGRCGMHTDISDLRAALKEAGL